MLAGCTLRSQANVVSRLDKTDGQPGLLKRLLKQMLN